MSTDVLEVQRARKALQAFCERRNRSRSASQVRLVCRAEGNVVELLETGGLDPQDGQGSAYALLRFSYDHGVWRVYWWRDQVGWELYPHLSETDSVFRVIDELEQAPLHVHWG